MLDACQLTEPPFYQCCCSCIYHKKVNHHCVTSPELREKRVGKEWVHRLSCVCDVQKGFACVVEMIDGAIHDNWPLHSVGCEMFLDKKENELIVSYKEKL